MADWDASDIMRAIYVGPTKAGNTGDGAAAIKAHLIGGYQIQIKVNGQLAGSSSVMTDKLSVNGRSVIIDEFSFTPTVASNSANDQIEVVLLRNNVVQATGRSGSGVVVRNSGWDAGALTRVGPIRLRVAGAEPPAPTPPPVPGPVQVQPPAPPAGSWTSVNPAVSIVDWMHNDPANPVYIWPDHMGMHDNPSKGRLQWPPPFQYGASRTLDRYGHTQDIETVWARLNPADNDFRWAGLDSWIDDNAGKTLCFCPQMTPQWAAKFPTFTGGYGSWPGSASPPKPGTLKKFLGAMFAHLDATGRAGRIRYVEPFNEFRTDESSTNLDLRSTANGTYNTKFLQMTANEAADMVMETYEACPSDVLVTIGAWEGKSDWGTINKTFNKVAVALGQRTASDGKNGKLVIRAISYHTYVYVGPSGWNRASEIRGYHSAAAGLGFTNATVAFDSELGAEYSGTKPDGSKIGKRFSDYTDAEQADSIERRVMQERGLKSRHSMLYNYRDLQGDSNEFPNWKTATNARITTLHGYGGGWIYRMGISNESPPRLWYSMLDKNLTQITRLV